MSMPGFAADRSLFYNTGRGHRSKAAGVSSLGESTVISQGRRKQNQIRNTVGFGSVNCDTKRVCIAGHNQAGPTGMRWVCDAYQTREIDSSCYWWPW